MEQHVRTRRHRSRVSGSRASPMKNRTGWWNRWRNRACFASSRLKIRTSRTPDSARCCAMVVPNDPVPPVITTVLSAKSVPAPVVAIASLIFR